MFRFNLVPRRRETIPSGVVSRPTAPSERSESYRARLHVQYREVPDSHAAREAVGSTESGNRDDGRGAYRYWL